MDVYIGTHVTKNMQSLVKVINYELIAYVTFRSVYLEASISVVLMSVTH